MTKAPHTHTHIHTGLGDHNEIHDMVSCDIHRTEELEETSNSHSSSDPMIITGCLLQALPALQRLERR